MNILTDLTAQYRLLVLLACAIGAIITVQLSAYLWPITVWWLLAAVATYVFRHSIHRIYILAFYLGGLVSTISGFVLYQTQVPGHFSPRTFEVTGEVVSTPLVTEGRSRFQFKPSEPVQRQYTGVIQVAWYRPDVTMSPAKGDVWRLPLRIKPVHGLVNPGGFDYEQWMVGQGVRNKAYVKQGKGLFAQRLAQNDDKIEQLRLAFDDYIQASNLSPLAKAVLPALSVGLRHHVSQETWRVFRNTGTVHLMAISGLHVGVVAGLFYVLGFQLWGYTALRRTHIAAFYCASALAMLTAIFYAQTAGFSLPTQRALIMLLVWLSLRFLGWHLKPFNVLLLTATVLLFLDPFAALTSSFWLSFVAVFLVLTALHRSDGGDNDSISRIKVPVWLRVQVVLTLGMAPVLAALFGQIPLLSLLANTLAVPLVSLLLVPTLLVSFILVSLQLDFLAYPLMQSADWLLQILWTALSYIASVQWSVLPLPASDLWVGMASFLLITAALWFRVHKTAAAVLLVFGVAILFIPAKKMEEGHFSLTVLDVGQGLSVVVQTRNQTLLYDAGDAYGSGFNLGDAVVLPYLRQLGAAKIDAVVLSHDNKDHWGGMAAVQKQIQPTRIYASWLYNRQTTLCRAGQKWQWDGVDFEFIHPVDASNSSSSNNNSCVLKIANGRLSALLTGDIEQEAERRLLAMNRDQLDVDVLVVPHHGSKSSSTASFLKSVSPELSIISAGFLSRFGHPHASVVQRLQAEGSQVLNTAESGAVEVVFSDVLDIKQHRKLNRKYWHRP